jgi:hypothetical protein
MGEMPMPLMVTCAVSLAFWAVASLLAGVEEPWDAASFWTVIYPAALELSAVLGFMLARYQWTAGAIVMFAQIPVVMASSGVSSLLGAGVVYAAILSIPAIALSWFAGRVGQRYRR